MFYNECVKSLADTQADTQGHLSQYARCSNCSKKTPGFPSNLSAQGSQQQQQKSDDTPDERRRPCQ
jgi:hypothetical protein